MDIFRLPTHNTLKLLLATYGYPLVGGEERVMVADDAEVLHLDPGHLGVVLQKVASEGL